MSELNYNSIYDGVSIALHAAFPNSHIHGGNVKQGLHPRDFNVIMPSVDHTKQLGGRYSRTAALDVIYYPEAGELECYDVVQSGSAHS